MKRFYVYLFLFQSGFWMFGVIGEDQLFGTVAAQSVREMPVDRARQAPADTPNPLTLAGEEPRHRVELFQAFGKRPVLLISYPWKQYSRPSIEVRFFSSAGVDDERIQPLFFRNRFLKGKMLQAIDECWLEAEDVPVRKTFSFEGQDWLLLGDRTILSRPAVCVLREIPPEPRLRIEPATAVVYPFLEQWAEDEDRLCLELPARYYPQPGQLRIWFLRDNRVLWTEKLAWPGAVRSQ